MLLIVLVSLRSSRLLCCHFGMKVHHASLVVLFIAVARASNFVIPYFGSNYTFESEFSLVGRQSSCQTGEKTCGSLCIPADAVCCSSKGNYCKAGFTCHPEGCCPECQTCVVKSGCDAGQVKCNDKCIDEGDVCCAGGGSCKPGQRCAPNNACYRGEGSPSSEPLTSTTGPCGASPSQGSESSSTKLSTEPVTSSTGSISSTSTTGNSEPVTTSATAQSTASPGAASNLQVGQFIALSWLAILNFI